MESKNPVVDKKEEEVSSLKAALVSSLVFVGGGLVGFWLLLQFFFQGRV